MKAFALSIVPAAFFIMLGWMVVSEQNSQATMMKACVENGGDWVKNWGNHDCIRKGNVK